LAASTLDGSKPKLLGEDRARKFGIGWANRPKIWHIQPLASNKMKMRKRERKVGKRRDLTLKMLDLRDVCRIA